MTRVLYINASPRGDVSASLSAARIFIDALHEGTDVLQIDLFNQALPEVTAAVTSAKIKYVMGAEMTDDESRQWSTILKMVDEFKAADHYLFGIPMWNFSIPYRLKHYIDLITHPGLTFTRDANGPRGLASGGATLIYSRGGDYSPKDGKPDPFDFQTPYMKAWLTMIGISPIEEILVQGTLAGPEGAARAVDAARDRLTDLGRQVGS